MLTVAKKEQVKAIKDKIMKPKKDKSSAIS
jgi:hypothetical protein